MAKTNKLRLAHKELKQKLAAAQADQQQQGSGGGSPPSSPRAPVNQASASPEPEAFHQQQQQQQQEQERARDRERERSVAREAATAEAETIRDLRGTIRQLQEQLSAREASLAAAEQLLQEARRREQAGEGGSGGGGRSSGGGAQGGGRSSGGGAEGGGGGSEAARLRALLASREEELSAQAEEMQFLIERLQHSSGGGEAGAEAPGTGGCRAGGRSADWVRGVTCAACLLSAPRRGGRPGTVIPFLACPLLPHYSWLLCSALQQQATQLPWASSCRLHSRRWPSCRRSWRQQPPRHRPGGLCLGDDIPGARWQLARAWWWGHWDSDSSHPSHPNPTRPHLTRLLIPCPAQV